MKIIGRNDPCPCGSGKKYKQCCLNVEQQADSKDILWRKLGETNARFAEKLLEFAVALYGTNVVLNAWEDFILDEGREFDRNSHENQLFFPWMLYSWLPGIVEEGNDEFAEQDIRTIAESYLGKNGHQLSTMDRRFIQLATGQPYSFYEIIDCDPGAGFRLKDVLTGMEIDVSEKSGSQQAAKGQIVFCQVIQYDHLGMIIGMAPFLIPPVHKIDIINLRKAIMENGPVEMDDLFSWEVDIRLVYLSIHRRMFTPPKLVNTDGDAISLQDICYEISSPQIAFDKLKGLAIDSNEQELLADAKFDENGGLKEIEFPWLKLGNLKMKSWKNTILGHISINKNQLKITVNSEKRASAIKKQIKSSLGDHAVYLRTQKHSLDSLTGKKEIPPKNDTSDEPDAPELQKVIDDELQEYWKHWLHEKIPALMNKSPVTSMKDPDGREMIKALLDDFELRDRNAPAHQKQQKYIDWARRELGLV